jgi:hypothetical protein
MTFQLRSQAGKCPARPSAARHDREPIQRSLAGLLAKAITLREKRLGMSEAPEPPFGADGGLGLIKTGAVQIWTLCAPGSLAEPGSPRLWRWGAR